MKMRRLLPLSATSVILWLQALTLVHGQIAVGCYQNQPDENSSKDSKTYQDIYMSQGSCSNFCRTNNLAYAMMTEGSTCFCSNEKPQDSNKVDDAKCDKPCMGYPFEKCGAASSKSIANVLLIGSTPPSSGSTSSGSEKPKNSPSVAGDGTNKGAIGMGEEARGSGSGSGSAGSGGEGKDPHTDSPGGTLPETSGKESKHVEGGRGEDGRDPMLFGTPTPPPPQGSRDAMSGAIGTTTTITTNINDDILHEKPEHTAEIRNATVDVEEGLAQSIVQSMGPQVTLFLATTPHPTTRHPQYSLQLSSGRDTNGTMPSEGSGGSSAGAIAASVMAIVGLAGLFAVAVVFQKRRQEKLLARASWSENMPLPSSLLSNSSNVEEDGGHHHRHHSVRRHGEYTRLTPGYHHPSSSMDGTVPSAPTTALPPPPVFHPRQHMHLHQPSYPPPPGHFGRQQYVSHGLHEPVMIERPSNNPQAIIAGRVGAGYEYCPPSDNGEGYGYYPHPSNHNHPIDLPMRRGSHTNGHGQRTRESMDSGEFQG